MLGSLAVSESTKTAVFAVVAGTCILLAVVTSPRVNRNIDANGSLQVGTLLFNEKFADASQAASLKITRVDEDKLTMETFEIARDKASGLWKIPSEYDYPADATEQVQKATTPLSDLKILDVVSTSQGDQSLYGVVEPNDKLTAGVTGIGMLVSVADENRGDLARLIIGKEDADQPGLRFVRIPNQDPIYRVELDPAVFATDFKKWIKGDLLEVRSFDINQIKFRDYEIVLTQNGAQLGARMRYNMDADLTYDTSGNAWQLDRMLVYDGGQPQPAEMAAGEELKNEKLNAVRTAAQSLQIVGVLPKPKGLAADLKAEKALLESDEAKLSLFQKGFVPQEINGATEVYASGGETLLVTQDGVIYSLRFGEQRLSEAAVGGESDEAAEGSARERYLLVTARLDEERFPLPDLQPVPESLDDLRKLDAEKRAQQAPAAQPAADDSTPVDVAQPAEAPADSNTPADLNSPADSNTPADSNSPAEDAAPVEDASAPGAEPSADASAADPADNDEAALNACGPQEPAEQAPAVQTDAASDTAVQDTAVQDTAVQEAAPANPAATPAVAEGDETEEEMRERLAVVREEITKANQRLIDARNDKMSSARKKVQVLNAKFADWYYLIGEASYQQLRLKRADFIGPKGAAPAAPAAPGDLPFGFPGLPGLPPGGLP
jgi:hypothetical protein